MRRSARPYLWVLGLLWLLPAVGVTVGYLLLPKHVEGAQCEGIGFGCQLPPADAVLFLAVIAGPFLVVAGALGCAVVAVVQARRARRMPVR